MTTYSKTFTLMVSRKGTMMTHVVDWSDYDSLNDALSNAFDQGYDGWDILDDEGKPVASTFHYVNGHWMELIDPETGKSVHGKAYFRDHEDMHKFLDTFDNSYDKRIGAS